MPKKYIFWVLMILWAIFGLFPAWPHTHTEFSDFGPFGREVIVFCLFFLLGWHCFGFVVSEGPPKAP